jgi:hypothetical protein
MAKGKEPTMKLTNLIWVLAMAGMIAACNSGPPVEGCKPGEIVNFDGRCEQSGGMGGTPGTGGTGGSVGGACTNDADQAVYADLTYTNADGVDSTGSAAASAIASDCVFAEGGTVGPACDELAGVVVVCALTMSCTEKQVQDLIDCVGDCTQNTIESITDSRLTDACGACYSESVACSAEQCATSGCSSPTSTPCVRCRCEKGCTPGFDVCSGLPPSGACDPFL